MGSQVIVQLVVREPIERVPEEDGAGMETAAHFSDPGIVESHPARALVDGDVAGFDILPESAIVQVLVGGDGVDGPAAALGVNEDFEGFAEDGAFWRTPDVGFAAGKDYGWAEAEQYCRQKIG